MNHALMTLKQKLITPEEAQLILDKRDNYRKIDNKLVNTYLRLMQNYEWYWSILLFDEDGLLVDGQHRLMAVIKNEKPMLFACISGFPRVDAIAIDAARIYNHDQKTEQNHNQQENNNEVVREAGTH